MEDLAAEFCRGAKERPGFRYSKELRRLAVEYTRQAREQGYSQRQIAERLGVSESAVVDWLRRAEEPDAPRRSRVHEVKLTEPAVAAASQPVLVMPSGARVEGLSMGELATLLGALG
jgi:transcriptional regulator with XRE-family HTH domain